MAKLSIKPGSTDVSLLVFIQDSTSGTGAGKTGLAYNTASLVCYYARPGAAAAALSLVTQTVTGAHSDGGFVEVDATNMPGVYRLDLSDAIVAASARSAVVMLKGATGMAPLVLEIDLNAEVNATHVGGTTQTGRDLGASVLLSSGTGTGQISLSSGAVTVGTNNDKTGYTASTVSDKTGYALTSAYDAAKTAATQTSVDTVDTVVDAIKVKTDYLPSATAGAAGGVFIAGSNAATSVTTALTCNITGDITGNISGSVGSVTAEVSANVTKISGDGTAADNLEAYCDGTTAQPVNVTKINSVTVDGAGTSGDPWGPV